MKKEFLKCVLAIIGGMLVGIATGWILLPLRLSTGGFSGIATLIYYLFHVPAGWVTLALNIPLFLVAIKIFGIKYSVRTFLSMLAVSISIEIATTWQQLTSDMILASLFGGLVIGVGIALTVIGDSTTGGTDLVAKLIQSKRKYLNMGEILLVIDGLIIIVSAFTFDSIDVALYSGIAVFTMTKVVDLILEGGNYAKAVFIISDKAEEISNYLKKELDLGVTILDGQGAYSHKDKNVLLCVTNKREIPKIKEEVEKIDDKSFTIITTVTEAIGEGWSNWNICVEDDYGFNWNCKRS